MKTKTISIKDIPLKQFLKIFDPQDSLEVIEFGDTLHPSSGYISKDFLKNPKIVQDLLTIDYDFAGLIIFEAKIANYSVQCMDNTYNISGNLHDIQKILYKIPNENH